MSHDDDVRRGEKIAASGKYNGSTVADEPWPDDELSTAVESLVGQDRRVDHDCGDSDGEQ